jgi:dolichol-phosphate mannosyltransferase
MEYARDTLHADAVYEFDADLSHDPSKLPLFLDELDKGADMVLGTRYKLGGSIPADWGFHRKFLSVVGNLTIMFILGDFRYRDWTSGYRCLRTSVFSAVAPLLTGDTFSGYTFQIGSLYFALQKGFKVVEAVPYAFVDRTIGQSKIGPEYMKNTLEFIIAMRMKSLLQSRILKFVLVGGFGALVQLVALQFWRQAVSPLTNLNDNQQYLFADFLAIETAIISNFVLNNIWTFKDATLKKSQIPLKFLAFNLSSAGSIIIQLTVAWIGAHLIGIFDLIVVPVVYFTIDTGLVFVAVGILLGMIWNYFAYTRLIWRTASKK